MFTMKLCAFVLSFLLIKFVRADESSSFTLPISNSYHGTDSFIQVKLQSSDGAPVESIVSQNCNGNVMEMNVTVNSVTATDFDLPEGFVGQCTYSAVLESTSVTPPPPVTVYVQIPLNSQFSSPINGSAYGVNTIVPVRILTEDGIPYGAVVTQNCGGNELAQAVIMNVANTFDFQLPLEYVGPCSYSATVGSTAVIAPDPANINVEVQETSRFTSPIQFSSFPPGNLAPVSISSSDGLPYIATVTQNCTGLVLIQNVTMNSGTPIDFQLPNDFMGACEYSATVNSIAVSPPSDIVILVYVGVFISSEASALAGSDTNVVVFYSPPTDPPGTFEVTLDCGTGTNETQSILGGFSIVQTFAVPSTFYGVDCLFTVQGNDTYPALNSANITINQQMTMEQPDASTFVTWFPVLVTTSPDSSLAVDYVVYLDCASRLTETFQTNSESIFQYSNNDYNGNCTVGIASAPEYFILPDPVNIFILIPITINAPAFIFIGQPFTIEITSAGTVPPGESFIDVFLRCENTLMQTWPNTPVNKAVSLLVASNLSPALNCFLFTPDNNPIFVQNYTLTAFGSPSGGAIYPITQEQQQEFLAQIIILGNFIFA
jgi:hypothetical protein